MKKPYLGFHVFQKQTAMLMPNILQVFISLHGIIIVLS